MAILEQWHGDMYGITIGKEYKTEGDTFLDDRGCSRFVSTGIWREGGEEEEYTEEHTGGSSSYYTVEIKNTTTPYRLTYTAECNDIIEALGMSFAEGNAFKAIWRTAAARQGKKKKGNNAVYDAEKVVFFGERMLVAAKEEI